MEKVPKCWMPALFALKSESIVMPASLPDDVVSRTRFIAMKRLGLDAPMSEPLIVFNDAPVRARYAVETFAWYFKREFGYDFCQYAAQPARGDGDDRDFAALWSRGAACFRMRRFETSGDAYELAWVWFHPFHRGSHRTGHSMLGEAWPTLRAITGRLAMSFPISAAMNGFLRKMGEEFDGESVFLKPRDDAQSHAAAASRRFHLGHESKL